MALGAQAADAAIEGRVLTESGPLAGATVFAHRSYADLQAGLKPISSVKADKEGVYRLDLPPGAYFFTASGEQDGRSFYAYHGSNPLQVTTDRFWLGLPATPADPLPAYGNGTTGLEGLVTYKGKPLEDAYLALYKPDSRTFKGLGVKTESIGPGGRFSLEIEPGSYVVTARKIANGKSNRPLQQGDLYCYYSRNPVEVKADQKARIELSCYPKDSREDFVATQKIKSDQLNSLPERVAALKAGLRGKVVDQAGQPVAGMNVLAYRLTSPVFMMYHVYHGSEYSALTDQQGAFFIPLDADGDYGVVARDVLGDGPHRGEMYGLYQENIRHAVTFKQGQTIENINIIAGKVMEDTDRADLPGVTPQIVIGRPDGPAVTLKDTVITEDTVWQGEIIIQGVVAVQRGATLVIRPGTIVRFKKTDHDKNKVGDGEILVEGRLVAKGTPEKRIIFTSAEAKPAINDWSYLQFLASNKGNIIDNCVFEYAFAGVMIHYANVKISNTLFRNNNRGVHYNTADLHLDHSTFINNRIGIRFMRMEGDVQITNNHISQNDIGVLFVRQHVNAVNFEKLNRGQEAPRYEGNNIYANRNYNFSLGEEQERDITVSGNWWGSTSKDEIEAQMYDQSKHESLSRIHFVPFLVKPVSGAGVPGFDPEKPFEISKKGAEQQQTATVSGRFLQADGTPLSGALLYLYDLARGPLPSPNRYWRVPNQSMEIDPDGRFSIQLAPGEYSLGAIKRSKGQHIGPPEAGDLFMLSLDEKGQVRRYGVKPDSQIDLGDIRESRQTAKSSKPATVIVGTITDSDKKPLAGVYAFAFPTRNAIGKPLYISEPSDSKGRFKLYVAEGASYHLKVRGNLGGGPPQTGLVLDGNKQDPLVKVSVSTGQTSEPVTLNTKIFPGRGRQQ